MKLKKPIIIVFVICAVFISQRSAAVDIYQFTFLLSPSFETMNLRSKAAKGQFGYKLSYNFGFEYKYFLDPELSISAGLMYQNKGLRTIPADSTGETGNGVIKISSEYISLPLNMNYHIKAGQKTRILITAGFTNGYLINQTLIGKKMAKDAEVNMMGEDVSDNRQNIDLFKRHYFGLNLGVALVQYIHSKVVLEVQPMYLRQLNKALKQNAAVTSNDPVTPKFDSFALDIKVGYYFNKQISKAKKSF